MELLQEQAIAPIGEKPSNHLLLKLLLNVNLISVLINFSLNFAGSPALKYLYILHLGITLISVLTFNFMQVLPIVLSLFFLEGQGRVLWANALWTKFIFDAFIMISVLKIFIINKKIFNLKNTPLPLVIFIALHFFWYLLEFSNLNSISYFAVFAASKIYVYPVFFFLALNQIDFNVSQDQFQKCLNFFIFLLILELGLTFFHYNMKEQFILGISPNYNEAMKGTIFTGAFYRPFATTFAPGAIAAYFYLTVGLLFLKKKSFLGSILRPILISLLAIAIVFCQVRSSLIKIVSIVLLIQLSELIYQRFKPKAFFSLITAVIFLIISSNFITDKNTLQEDTGMENIRNRFSSIGSANTIQKSRISVPQFFIFASDRLIDKPLGFGPGLTGAVSGISADEIKESHFITRDMTWTNDNLFMTLLADFGIGAIFYFLILIYIPLYFFQFTVTFYRKKCDDEYKILSICLSSIIVIIIGNWGAVGITYNPESFIFWLFTALGFSTISRYKTLNLKIA